MGSSTRLNIGRVVMHDDIPVAVSFMASKTIYPKAFYVAGTWLVIDRIERAYRGQGRFTYMLYWHVEVEKRRWMLAFDGKALNWMGHEIM